jgi:predicted DNA-binding transcriptional regulator AlpA
MQNITFDTLPAVVTKILDKVNDIERLLNMRSNEPSDQILSDRWLSLTELIAYLPGNPSKATIYGKVHHREIPHKKFGSRLAFRQSEIDDYLQTLHRKTQTEIDKEAEVFIQRKKNHE